MTPIAFYHTASWCQPCKQLKPVARRLIEESGGTFCEVDVEFAAPLLPEIAAIPTLVIYDTGGSEPVAILGPSQITPAAIRKAIQ